MASEDRKLETYFLSEKLIRSATSQWQALHLYSENVL